MGSFVRGLMESICEECGICGGKNKEFCMRFKCFSDAFVRVEEKLEEKG